ncbi:MAG: Sf3a2-prov protein [Rhizobium sp.]
MAKHGPILSPAAASHAGLPNPLQPPLVKLPRVETEDDAYAKGVEAGKKESIAEKNPYPENSSRAKAFEHGYLDGQKIRSDDKPPS